MIVHKIKFWEIRKYIYDAGFTQLGFCFYYHVSFINLRRILKNKVNFSYKTLLKLAELMKIPCTDLIIV